MTPEELRAALQTDDTGRYFILDADKNPQPVDFLTWAEWFETADRLVCQDKDEGGEGVHRDICVSTVFLGLDHSFGSGPPMIYETMIFGGPMDGECRRYSTREDAVIGHQLLCAELRQLLKKDA